MGLVGKITKKVDIPHEPGEHMTLRKLSWRQLEAAQDAHTDAALERMAKMGGDIVAAVSGLDTDLQQQAKDPASGYDRAIVLTEGIAAWSYKEPLTPENIDQLDEETAAWAFDEILALNMPRSEGETKNG